MTWLQRLLAADDAPRLRLSDWLRFSGRASKGEFRAVFNPFVSLVAAVLAVTAAVDGLARRGDWSRVGDALTLPVNLCAYAGFLVLMAVMARRIHDFGRSAWWVLLYLIPPIPLVMIILCWFQDGQPTANRYGPVPPERVRLW